MQFTQHIVVYAENEANLLSLMREWEASDNTAMSGYGGGRLLRFREKPGRYVIQADFSSWEAAQANNARPETQRWAARLAEVITGDVKYEDLDVLAEFGSAEG